MQIQTRARGGEKGTIFGATRLRHACKNAMFNFNKSLLQKTNYVNLLIKVVQINKSCAHSNQKFIVLAMDQFHWKRGQ